MKKLFYILFFVFLNGYGFTQNYAPKKFYLIDSLNLASLGKDDRQLIDSCLTLYHKTKDDSTKINALSGICENMMDESWHKYQFFQYELINKVLKTQHSKLITQHLKKYLAEALNNIGLIYKKQGNITKALEYYSKSLKLQEEIGDKQGIAISLSNIGNIYFDQGDIPKALEYFGKSLQLLEEIRNKKGIATSLNNIGSIYSKQGERLKALEYYIKSLQLQKEIGDKEGTANTLNNIGVIYVKLDNISKALKYFGESLQLREEVGDNLGTANTLNNIGSIYKRKGDPSVTTSKEDALRAGIPKALEYYNKCLQLLEEIGDKQGIASSLNNIGNTYLTQHQVTTARNYYKKAYQLSKELGYPELIENAASGLKEVY